MKISNLHKLLIVLTVVLLAVAGAYFFVPARKKAPVMAINNNQNTKTNASIVSDEGLAIYSEPALGIEFQYPKSWGDVNTSIGQGVGDDPFWQENILGMGFLGGGTDESSMNLSLKVKQTDLSFNGFLSRPDINMMSIKSKRTTIAGSTAAVDGWRESYEKVDGTWGTHEFILIKRNDIYYYFDFGAFSKFQKNVVLFDKEWDALLSSIRLFNPS